jgi:electron transport complex protein RnfA
VNLLAIVFVAILANNIVFNQFLGICPYLGVSKRLETSLGMGIAVTFVMAMAAIVTWVVYIWKAAKRGFAQVWQ